MLRCLREERKKFESKFKNVSQKQRKRRNKQYKLRKMQEKTRGSKVEKLCTLNTNIQRVGKRLETHRLSREL
jgi:hypothetical protein